MGPTGHSQARRMQSPRSGMQIRMVRLQVCIVCRKGEARADRLEDCTYGHQCMQFITPEIVRDHAIDLLQG